MSRLVVQTYKAPHQWRSHPPGLGDFLRGACHLFERLDGTGIELRLDVSQTGFANLIEPSDTLFYCGRPDAIAGAGEYFEDDAPFEAALASLQHAEAGVLHVCSNMGAWNRPDLPERTRAFFTPFFQFAAPIERAVTGATDGLAFRVLSIRCGDRYFDSPDAPLEQETMQRVCAIVEREIIADRPEPLVVMSDSRRLKSLLAERFDIVLVPHAARHGAFGGAEAVATDLCLLKRSRFNYHINAWTDWWSGFSHYTSLIFKVPSANFSSPRFDREEVPAKAPRRWWARR